MDKNQTDKHEEAPQKRRTIEQALKTPLFTTNKMPPPLADKKTTELSSEDMILYDWYQRTIRHRDYIDFCLKYEDLFDSNGILVPAALVSEAVEEKILPTSVLFDDENSEEPSIKKQERIRSFAEDLRILKENFDLDSSEIPHCNTKLSIEAFLALPGRLFKNKNPIMFDWPVEKVSRSHTILRADIENNIIELKINISPGIPAEYIGEQVKKLVISVRKQIDQKGKRNRFNELDKLYRVWDLRVRRISFIDISRTLGIKYETCVSRFRKAWEHIYGTHYSKKYFEQVIQSNLLQDNNYDEFLKQLEVSRKEPLHRAKDLSDQATDSPFSSSPGGATKNEMLDDIIRLCHPRNCPDKTCSTKFQSQLQPGNRPTVEYISKILAPLANNCPKLRELLTS